LVPETGGLYVPDSIQPGEHSKGSGTVGFRYESRRLRRERELELRQPEVERQHVDPRRRQLERW